MGLPGYWHCCYSFDTHHQQSRLKSALQFMSISMETQAVTHLDIWMVQNLLYLSTLISVSSWKPFHLDDHSHPVSHWIIYSCYTNIPRYCLLCGCFLWTVLLALHKLLYQNKYPRDSEENPLIIQTPILTVYYREIVKSGYLLHKLI